MNKLLGYSLMSVGLLGFFWFLNYKGTAVPLRELWFVLSICILIAGGYLVARYKLQELNNQRSDNYRSRAAEIQQLKRAGEKVKITLGNAEVKSRSYQQEIINDSFPSRSEIIDGLYNGNRNFNTQTIQQTYLVAYKQYKGKTYKFVSQATTQNTVAVKRYIDRQGVYLYIDPNNPTKYYFDLPFV